MTNFLYGRYFLYARDPEGKLIVGISFEELDKFRVEYIKQHMPIDEKIAINQFVADLMKEAEQDMINQLTVQATHKS